MKNDTEFKFCEILYICIKKNATEPQVFDLLVSHAL